MSETIKIGGVVTRLSLMWARGQVDTATGFGPVDPGFKSLRARHYFLNLPTPK